MSTDPGKLANVPQFHTKGLYGRPSAQHTVRETSTARYVGGALVVHGETNFVADLKLQAHELDRILPRDLHTLKQLAWDHDAPMEWRAKILEVMIYRGATNELSYSAMAPGAAREDVHGISAFPGREDEFRERRAYQEAARDTVFGDPRVFAEMSKSEDQLPQGRSGGTEFMNMMLRNGGVYGNHDAVQEFEKRFKAVEDPEIRGRMMYHINDAGAKFDVHLKGEQRATGWSVGFSGGNAAASAGFEFGKQWEFHPDNHWKQVGADVTRAVSADLRQNREDRPAFGQGYRDSASRDRLGVSTEPAPGT